MVYPEVVKFPGSAAFDCEIPFAGQCLFGRISFSAVGFPMNENAQAEHFCALTNPGIHAPLIAFTDCFNFGIAAHVKRQ